jgi:hypothetical protein
LTGWHHDEQRRDSPHDVTRLQNADIRLAAIAFNFFWPLLSS